MTQRASESLVAVLIRVGLLLALAILLMAENAQAKVRPANPGFLSYPARFEGLPTGRFTSPQLQSDVAGARTNWTA
jgi:hypothetical protein